MSDDTAREADWFKKLTIYGLIVDNDRLNINRWAELLSKASIRRIRRQIKEEKVPETQKEQAPAKKGKNELTEDAKKLLRVIYTFNREKTGKLKKDSAFNLSDNIGTFIQRYNTDFYRKVNAVHSIKRKEYESGEYASALQELKTEEMVIPTGKRDAYKEYTYVLNPEKEQIIIDLFKKDDLRRIPPSDQ